MADSSLLKGIQDFFKGEVFNDGKTMAEYSHDASLLRVTPELVLYPKDSEDIQNLVKFVSKEKATHPTLSITARSAGTDMSGGPLNDSIIIDFTKHITGVPFISARKMEATVLPGTYYRDFEKETLKYNLILPSYTASKDLCAIGGMIANNSGGEKTLQYGKTEKYINELNIIFSDGNEYVVKTLTKPELDVKMAQNDFEGNIYKQIFELVTKNQQLLADAKPKVSKNSAGYYLWNVWDGTTFNLNRLLVGSQGTLGIVTAAKLQLVPTVSKSKLFVIFLKDLTHVSEIVNVILPFKPESLESYDDHTLKMALKFFPSLLKRMKIGNLLKLMFSFIPEVFMLLTGGIPKLIMLVEFTGNDDKEIDQKMKDLEKALVPFKLKERITKTIEEAEKYWTIRRESFNLLRQHVRHMRTAPFIDDIIVRPEFLPEFIPKLTAILDEYKLLYTVAGHAGDGNFHIIPLMDMHVERNKEVIKIVSEKVYDLVLQYKGSITAEHNDGIIRTPFLPKMYGPEVYKLFEETKHIFDPLNIFNPGKKVGGSVDYMMKHIASE